MQLDSGQKSNHRLWDFLFDALTRFHRYPELSHQELGMTVCIHGEAGTVRAFSEDDRELLK